jgi:hypothetical protein
VTFDSAMPQTRGRHFYSTPQPSRHQRKTSVRSSAAAAQFPLCRLRIMEPGDSTEKTASDLRRTPDERKVACAELPVTLRREARQRHAPGNGD